MSSLSTSIAGSVWSPYFNVYDTNSNHPSIIFQYNAIYHWQYSEDNPNAHLTVEFMTYVENRSDVETCEIGFWDIWFFNLLNANYVGVEVSTDAIHHVAFVLQFVDSRHCTYKAYVDGVLTKTATKQIVRSTETGVWPCFTFESKKYTVIYVQNYKISTGRRYKGDSFTAPTNLNQN